MKKLAISLLSLLSAASWAAAGYTELDYVEATGAQWVDTGIVGRYDTRVEIQAEWRSDVGDMSLLACRGDDGTADNPTRINFMNCDTVSMGWGYGVYRTARGWETERVYTVVAECARTDASVSCSLAVDGLTVDTMTTDQLVDTGCSLAIFGNNVHGSVSGLAKARCYGLKIWQKPAAGGDYVLVRDFVPVAQDGRAGFRDAVSGGFFFSATATDLVAGPDVDTPDVFVDYVESTGSEYVDLGVVGRSGVTMESRMAWVETPEDGTYAGARLGADARFYLYHYYESNALGYGGFCQSSAVSQPGVVQDVRTVLKAGEQSMAVDGTTCYAQHEGATVNTELSLYLFACNRDGAPAFNTKARCYSLKLWDGDALVRDFRPCLKRGRAALYDQVSGTIFHPRSGALKAMRLPTPGRPDYFVEYVETRGDNYVDTGIRARNDTRAAGEFQLTTLRLTDYEDWYYLSQTRNNHERTILGACGNSDGNGNARFYLAHAPDGRFWIAYDEWKCYPDTVQERLDLNRHTFDVTLADGRQTAVLDGRDLGVSNVVGSVDAGVNLYMFACNRGGTPCYRANARIYSMKIWQKPEAGGDYALVRDLRPCVKDGEAGFHDAVKDEILHFADVVPAHRIGQPVYTDDMQPAEILEFVDSDRTQWIDTGVTGRTGTVAEFRMAWLDNGENPDVGFLGSRRDGGDTRFYMWHNAFRTASFGYGEFRYFSLDNLSGTGSENDPGTIALVDGEPLEAKVALLSDEQTAFLNGTKILDSAYAVGHDTGHSMYIFAENYHGTAANLCAARLYRMKIWQDGALVRNFLPVRLDSGLPALYDTVGKKVYAPQGGTLAAGPVVRAYARGSAILVR